MTDAFVITGRRTLLALAAVTALWSSWVLSAYLGRMLDAPTALGSLAPRQVASLIPAVLVASSGAAFATSRVCRRGAGEIMQLAARGQWVVSGRMILETSSAVAVGWLVFWTVSSVRFGEHAQGAFTSSLALITSLTCIPVGAAVGHVTALVVPRVAAAPTAAVLAYCWMWLGGGLGDDQWWQGLNPSLGPYFTAHTPVAWFAAEAAWFLGVTAMLASTAGWLGSKPSRTSVWLLMTGAASAGGGATVLTGLGVT